MEDFIRNQFLIHGDMDVVSVKRRAGIEKPDYQFDVEVDVKEGAKGWPYTTKVLFGAFTISRSEPFGPAVYLVQDIMVNTVGASVMLLVAVILTGFFIPNMLRKGSLDLLVAKPMARWELLLYKYIGGLIFMLMISSLCVGGVWFVMALRSGNWNPTFLLSIPIITFTFAVLYAVSTLVAVLTRSAIAAILITAVFMVLMWAVGFAKTLSDGARILVTKEEDKQRTVFTVIDVTNAVLPRYNDVLKLNSLTMTDAYCTQSVAKASRRAVPPSWTAATGLSVTYMLAFLGLSDWRFSTRDP
jgi:ABC-type transport system involved in multi-copper enzyme maturation permease subunit